MSFDGEAILASKLNELHPIVLQLQAKVSEYLTCATPLRDALQSDESALVSLQKLRTGLSLVESFENEKLNKHLCSAAIQVIHSTLMRLRENEEDTPPANHSLETSSHDFANKNQPMVASGSWSLTRSSDLKVKWINIIGAGKAVAALKQAVVLPIRMPQLFQGSRKPWSCILLYGPPGTGKTLLASAAAAESGMNFLPVSASDLLSKWVGDTEKMIRELFESANSTGKCLIFLDEIDALCSTRGGSGAGSESESSRRLKTEFLVRLQSIDISKTIVIAATNVPWELDIAFRRRFDRLIFVGLPDVSERQALLSFYMKDVQHCISVEEIALLASELNGYSPSDIQHICQHASMIPIERLQQATHFKPAACVNSVSQDIDMLEPCLPDDPHGVSLTLDEVDPSLIAPLIVTFEDLKNAATMYPRSVSDECISSYASWEKSASLRR